MKNAAEPRLNIERGIDIMASPTIENIRKSSDDGRYTEALSLCDEFLLNSPASVEFYFERAHILNDLGRRDEAIQDLGALLVLDGAHAGAYFQRAMWLLAANRAENGLEDLRHVIELGEPYFLTSAYFFSAVSLLNLGKNSESLSFAMKLPDDYSYNSRLQGKVHGLLTRDQLIALAQT